MASKWIGAAYSTPGRDGNSVEFIVPHISECGTLAGIDATFTGGGRQASAHYGVDDNNVHQYVGESDTAWAVGNWSANTRSISIECVGSTGNQPSRATLDRCAELMVDLATRHGLGKLVLGDNVGLHKWYSATSCPATLDVAYLMARIDELQGGGADGWRQMEDGRWWWRWADGTYPANKWQAIEGVWYAFDEGGYLRTGWFLDPADNSWYWLGSNGQMRTGWLSDGSGGWYWLDASGRMATGWRSLGGSWFWFDAGGSMATGWRKVDGVWYWLKDGGYMAHRECLCIGDAWYAFAANGAMIERYVTVGESGALVM